MRGGRYAVFMRPPRKLHRWGKRVCLVGVVVALAWGVVGNAGYTAASGGWSAGRSDAHRNVGVGVEGGYGGMRLDVMWGWTARSAAERSELTVLPPDWHGWWATSRIEPCWPQSIRPLFRVWPRLQSGEGLAQIECPSFPILLLSTGGWLVIRQRERLWRRLNSNACPKCKYPLTGLKPDAPCPECGAGRAAPSPEPSPRSSE